MPVLAALCLSPPPSSLLPWRCRSWHLSKTNFIRLLCGRDWGYYSFFSFFLERLYALRSYVLGLGWWLLFICYFYHMLWYFVGREKIRAWDALCTYISPVILIYSSYLLLCIALFVHRNYLVAMFSFTFFFFFFVPLKRTSYKSKCWKLRIENAPMDTKWKNLDNNSIEPLKWILGSNKISILIKKARETKMTFKSQQSCS